jgi:hypothetical protein
MTKLLSAVRYVRSTVLLCLIIGVLFFSCSSEDESSITPKEEIADELVQFLENSGFDKKNIVLKDGIFTIEEDILISKQEVEAYIALNRTHPNGREQHYRGTYLVSDTYVTNIKFYISPSVSSSWATAIRGAVSQWNAVNGTKLFMSEVTTSGAANTIINTGYSTENWVARAYLPSSSRRPGHTMTINTRYNSLSSAYKLFTIVHEMGHIFGLYHTNQTQGIFINGTPATDPNSVMNSFILPWNGFTDGDVTAVQIIYPG